MKTTKKDALKIVGISTKTINAPKKAEVDIPALWQKFGSLDLANQLAEKKSSEVYCVYCNYEGDHTEPYTTLIGFSVPLDMDVPDNLVSVTIPANDYAVFVAEGDLIGGKTIETWQKIWQAPLKRDYVADFEVYGKEAANLQDGKIDIFIGINA